MTADLIFIVAGVVGAALLMWRYYGEINRAFSKIVTGTAWVAGWGFVVLVCVGGFLLALYILVRFVHWAWYQ